MRESLHDRRKHHSSRRVAVREGLADFTLTGFEGDARLRSVYEKLVTASLFFLKCLIHSAPSPKPHDRKANTVTTNFHKANGMKIPGELMRCTTAGRAARAKPERTSAPRPILGREAICRRPHLWQVR